MIDPGQQIAKLRGLIQLDWSDAHTARVRRAALQHRRRQLVARVGGAALLLIALCTALLIRQQREPRIAATTQAREPQTALQLVTMDRSSATAFSATDQLRLREDGPQRTVFELTRGRARFEVVRRPERMFRVEAGAVNIEVLGTVFTVEREAARVIVAVERGRVRVSWNGQSQELAAGRWDSFPRPPIAAQFDDPPSHATNLAPIAASEPAVEKTLIRTEAPRPPAASPPSLASAERIVRTSSPAKPRGHTRAVALLLREADAARLSANPSAAVASLQEILRDHRDDLRAPLAAFTLGKIQQEELGQPEAAARAFALALSLDSDGPLAEDAAAREVEAWNRAGQLERARERAADFVRRYPRSSRLPAVWRHGHLQ